MKPRIIRMSPYWACGTPTEADWMPGLTPWAAYAAWLSSRSWGSVGPV